MENHVLPSFSLHPQLGSEGGTVDGTVNGGQRRSKFGKFSHSGIVTTKLFMNNACKFTYLGVWSTHYC